MIRIIIKFIEADYNMFMKTVWFIALLMVVWAAPSVREASGCNVCHSKNPKMVRMHEELGFKDCFKCHGQGLDKTPQGRSTQMVSDSRCVPCHKK